MSCIGRLPKLCITKSLVQHSYQLKHNLYKVSFQRNSNFVYVSNNYLVSKFFSTTSNTEESSLLPGLSDNQIRKIGERDHELRSRHEKIEQDLSEEERDKVRRKRMIYRSKQRGWLEADILLGSWAVDNVPNLSKSELDEYEIILGVETIDIYNYVSGKDKPPEKLQNLSIMNKLIKYAYENKIIGPEAYERIKIEKNLT